MEYPSFWMLKAFGVVTGLAQGEVHLDARELSGQPLSQVAAYQIVLLG